MAIVQGVLMRPILKFLGERNTVIVGMGIDVVAFIFLAFVADGMWALIMTPLTALGSMAGPAMQGIMSRTASDNQQGELQGALSSINAIATIIAPLLMTQIFWYFTSAGAVFQLPGAPFLLSSVLAMISIGVFVTYRPKVVRV